jgi:hypothetical protein
MKDKPYVSVAYGKLWVACRDCMDAMIAHELHPHDEWVCEPCEAKVRGVVVSDN